MTYEVTAKRWDDGWELHVTDVGVTQCRTLDKARTQVADLIETMTDTRPSDSAIEIMPDINGIGPRVAEVRRMSEAAEAARSEAARTTREIVSEMRASGLSVTDVAAILGVSRGRVSQLSHA